MGLRACDRAAAVAIAAINVFNEEKLAERSLELGKYFTEKLNKIQSPYMDYIRGKGLFIGIVLKKEAQGARRFCKYLKKNRNK